MRLRTAAILSVIGACLLLNQARGHDQHFDDDDQRKTTQIKRIYTSSSNYTAYWSWMTDWQVRTDATVIPEAKKNSQCGAQIIKRKACLDSSLKKFHDDVEEIWDDLIDSLTQRTWGITKNKRDKNYGSWKNVTKNCSIGSYQDPNNTSNCLPCPRGCTTCNAPDKCLSCKKNFTFVEGYNFGYCLPDCQKGMYQQHLYTDDQSFCRKANLARRPQILSATQISAHCVKCPEFCEDCVYNEITGQPFCYQSRQGFKFDSNKTRCYPLTTCQPGQYKVRNLAFNQVLTQSTSNLDDYICRGNGSILFQFIIDCRPGCSGCLNNSTCSSCKPGYILSQGSLTNRTCLKCPDNCLSCNLNSQGKPQCKQCPNRYYNFNNGGQCVLNRTCSVGQWFNDSTLKCQSCPKDCLTCKQGPKNGTVVCLTCTSDTKLNGSACIEKCNSLKEFFNRKTSNCTKCPIGQYPDKSNQKCKPCTYKNCEDCVFKRDQNGLFGQEECSTCKKDFWFDSKMRMCRTQCNQTAVFDFYFQRCQSIKPGYYKNTSDDTSRPCSSSCQSCELPSNSKKPICKTCKSGLIIDELDNSQCRKNCSLGQYVDAQGWECKVCPSGKYVSDDSRGCGLCPKYCAGCNKNLTSKKLECSKCELGSSFDKNSKRCIPSCKFNFQYYVETESCRACPPYSSYSPRTKKCEPCNIKNCVDCIHPLTNKTKSQCYSCDSSTKMDYKAMTCRSICNSTTFYNNMTNTCEQCPSNQLYNATSNKCYSCNIMNCNECESSGTSCKICQLGYKLDISSGACIQNCSENFYFSIIDEKCVSCSPGQYYDQTAKKCTACSGNCSLCSTFNNKQICSQCQTGFILAAGSCVQCPANCSACSFNSATNKTICSACSNGWIIDEQAQLCKPSCPVNQQYDFVLKQCNQCPSGYAVNTTTQICKQCPTNCTSCAYDATSKSMQCTNCIAGFEVDSVKKICRPSCSSTQYYSSTTNQCVSCALGQYLNSTAMQCQTCPTNCASCIFNSETKLSECLTCNPDLILDTVNNLCRKPCSSLTPIYNSTIKACVSCPSSTYFSAGSCVQCPANCSACSFNSATNKTICSACSNGWIIDEQAQLCKPSCPVNQQYDFVLKQCNQCPSGYAVNTTTQICKQCPTNCTSCAYDATSKSMQCTNCIAGFEVDSVKKICRPSCSSTQYYSSTTNQCVSCALGQYLNSTAMQCQTCPTNCASCIFNNETKLPECLTCKTGLIFDLTLKKCKLNCSLTQYYDWDTNQCVTCSGGTFMNPAVEQCQICPDGCSTCSYNYVDKEADCQSCVSSLYVLDSSQQLCREKCNSTAYYSWDSFSCIDCAENQYLDPKSQSCQVCASNCQSCFFNSTGQVECSSCSSSFNLQSQTCIEDCNSTTYYDWSVGSCQTCPDGQWLNQNTKKCEFCGIGCNICAADDVDSNTSQCLECLPTLILDKEKCRKACEVNQFYDWTSFECVNCTYPCTTCSDALKCSACDEMFNYSPTDGVCTHKCNLNTQIWNQATKQCDLLRKFNLTVTAASTRVWRCRNTTVSTIGSGFTSSEVPSYTWSFEIIQGGWNRNNWLSDINSLLSTANLNNAKSIVISSAFTEKVTDNTTIKFIVNMNVNGQITTNSTNLIVDPYVWLTIGNYSKSYSVWAADGLPLYPAFYYPECPIFKGPQPIPANVSIGCSLYDSKSNLIKALPYCQIQKTELTPGLSYFIKYYYAPNPIQTGSTNGLRDTISVYAYAQLPACTITNSSQMYVRTSDTLYLQTQVINGKNTFVYKWNCNSITSGGVCGISSTTQNTPDLSLPASSLTQGAIYNFTMNMWENTVFQGACSAKVEVVSSTQVSITVNMIDQANSWNYINPSENQAIQCYQSTETPSLLSYSWRVVRKSTKSQVYQSGQASNGYSQSGSTLNILAGTLAADSYDITCSVQNLKYKGTTTKTYSTSPILPITLQLNISPSSGVAQDTVFTLTANKPQGYDLMCYFGQMTSENQEIPLSEEQNAVYSNAAQSLLTKLDRLILSDTQQLYINCYDEFGSYARVVKSVIVTSGQPIATSFIQREDLLLESELPKVDQIPQTNVQEESLGEKISNLPKSAKIMISMIPIVALIVLAISPLILFKKAEWENVPQSAGKIDDCNEVESASQKVEISSLFSSSKLSILLQRYQVMSFNHLHPKLISAVIFLGCFTLSLCFTSIANPFLCFFGTFICLWILEQLFHYLCSIQRLTIPIAIILAACLTIEPFVIILSTFNMEDQVYRKWTGVSFGVFVMSAVIQDFIIVPIAKLAKSKFAACKNN